jgi:hypothetical protein
MSELSKSDAKLSERDAEELRELAGAAAWWRHDMKVRALVRRGVTVRAIAEARRVAVQVIEEILRPPSTTLRKGRPQ